jgi:hypothetical protein
MVVDVFGLKNKIMIIVKIMGGVGNQMFQYALGINLASLHGTEVKFDISWFDKFENDTVPRYYSLQEFNIKENIATKEEIAKFEKYKKIPERKNFLHNLFIANNSIYIKEKSTNFDKNILEIKDNAYLYGYWQSEKYFENIKNEIIKEFTLKKPSDNYKKNEKEIIENDGTPISIHIRRGDYTSEKIKKTIGLCSLDYYYKAIEKITQEIKNPTFFIFTDDVDWVKDNLKIKYPTNFISYTKTSNGYKNKDYEELILMSKCKHNIISNSSFGWWGAWLNQNPNKIVITPKQWFKKTTMNFEDIPLESWLKI